jgi:hypothetical protein
MAETSANTQTIICQEICVDSGTTVTQVLGGPNGLNS